MMTGCLRERNETQARAPRSTYIYKSHKSHIQHIFGFALRKKMAQRTLYSTAIELYGVTLIECARWVFCGLYHLFGLIFLDGVFF